MYGGQPRGSFAMGDMNEDPSCRKQRNKKDERSSEVGSQCLEQCCRHVHRGSGDRENLELWREIEAVMFRGDSLYPADHMADTREFKAYGP